MEINCEVQPFSAEMREAYDRLLPEQMTLVERGQLDWKFAYCPAGKGVVALAKRGDDGSIVGINAFQPARLKIGWNRVLAFQSMDTIVDPVARGRGVFPTMIEAFYNASPRLGATALYGIPNDKSAPGFFNKLGWTRLGSPPFLVKPLRAGFVARKLIGRFGAAFDGLPLTLLRRSKDRRIEQILRFEPEVDALWEAFANSVPCAVDRTHDILNWRFFDHPALSYSVAGIRDAAGQLTSFVVWHLAPDKHGGSIGYVMEAMSRPGSDDDLRALLREAIGAMNQDGADVVLAWSAQHAPNHRAFRATGFWPLPEKVRPITLHFGGRVLSKAGEPAMSSPEAWYLSYFDSDTV